jgi:N-acetylglucosamine malate deacetylase 2
VARILYIFPHPDDESFGPAPVMARQRREGVEVSLLTLTRGEATRQREVLGVSLSEMGAIRFREMQNMASELDLTNLNVMRFPDGKLAEMRPQVLEKAIREEIERVEPGVIVTYAVHGISGHPDHLVTHNIVKRVFTELREDRAHRRYLKRLAFFTLPEAPAAPGRPSHLKSSPEEKIDCVMTFEREDLRRAEAALKAYVTYASVVAEHDPLSQVRDGVYYEFFHEDFKPPVDDLFASLPAW